MEHQPPCYPFAPLVMPERTFNSPLRRIKNASEEVSVRLNRLSSGSGQLGSRLAGLGSSSSLIVQGRGDVGGGKGEEIAMRGMKKTKGSPYNNTPTKAHNTNETVTESTRNLLGINHDLRPGSGASSLYGSRSNTTLYSSSNLVTYTTPSQIENQRQVSSSSTSTPISFPTSSSKPSYFESTPGYASSTRASSPTLPAGHNSNSKSNAEIKTSNEDAGSVRGGVEKREFELTPLSGLISQSIKDLEMLRLVHGRGGVSPSGYAPVPGDDDFVDLDVGLGGGVYDRKDDNLRSKGRFPSDFEARVDEIAPVSRSFEANTDNKATSDDFDQITEDLKMFEEMYRTFLQTPTSDGRPRTEIHLLAMVCKKSEIVRRC